MEKYISVAVDGPAGAGKSSVSKAVARRLGFVYIDTGAMYRACALYVIRNNIKIEEEALSCVLDNIEIQIKHSADEQIIFLNGEDVTKKIREPEVSMAASAIATIPAVRLKLVELQRELAESNNVIMDGRDIGTYVLPNAALKVYLTASVEARAKRRYDEMTGEKKLELVKKEIISRDENDMNRNFAPLKKAEDATVIDSSDMTYEQTCERLEELIARL